MKLGTLDISPPTILAPMADITDLPFRTICEELGAGLTVTEFIAAHGLAAGTPKLRRLLAASLEGRPYGVQLFGREEKPLVRAAVVAAEAGAHFIDINMGCPAKKVVWGGRGDGPVPTRGSGSALMLDPDLAARLVAGVRAAVPPQVPVTVKHRAGWDDQHRNAVEFARRMVDAGAALITVHGRTKAQGFSGECDRGIIAAVRAALPPAIPVVGNGDVVDLASSLRMRAETGCDAVMIGRAAVGNPWIFAALRAHEEGRPAPPPPTLAERRRVFLRHVQLCDELTPERADLEARKALVRYTKGLRGASELRPRAFTAQTRPALMDLAERFFAEAEHHPAPAPSASVSPTPPW
jgi:nifR3 family TIM-barrel protein